MAEEIVLKNTELDMLINNKNSGYNYRERRQEDWLENYLLYRSKVTINRLTQRQSVSLPLMKQTVRTLLKDVDDMPVLYFENLDNDEEAEVFENEYWKFTVEQNNMELQDIVDKRQVFLFGRSFDQWQVVDGKIKMTVQDPQDMLVSRYTDPTNIHSSRFLIHTHIFKPLSELENDPKYDKEAIKRLKMYYATQQGIVKAAENHDMLSEKNRKLAEMGLQDVDDPVLGETYVELSLHFVYRSGETGYLDEQLWLYVEAENMEILAKDPLEKVIGTTKDHFWRNHFPYNSWADDVERQDFWSDGIGDIVRPSAQVLNVWFSQMVENRTLRNFNMNVYDSTAAEGFTPGTFNPIPWGWYGVPGKPNEVYKQMEVADLSDSMDEINFVLTMLEKATGATSTQQGVQTERQITLGEVQLALGEAKERIKGMSKFYTPAWKQRGLIFLKLIEAASDELDAVKIYKKGRNTNRIYAREIGPKDWITKSGYQVKVWSQDDKDAQDTEELQKITAIANFFPGNQKLDEIKKRKLLEFGGLGPDEINEVMQLEQERADMAMEQNMMEGIPATQPAMPPVANQPAI